MDHPQHMAMDPPHDGGHGGMDDMCSMSVRLQIQAYMVVSPC